MEIREKFKELERQLNELKVLLKEEAKDDRPITERVRTFEDAVAVIGDEHPLVQQWWSYVSTDDDGDIPTGDNADLLAYLQLRIIAAALNEGWEPEFTADEVRYYPWFKITYGGVAYAYTDYDSPGTYSNIGARLAFKTDELAEYAGEQFEDIWADYLLVRKQSVPAEGAMA